MAEVMAAPTPGSTEDLESRIGPTDLSSLQQPGAGAQPAPQQAAPQAPAAPTLENRHPQLFSMLKALTIGVDSLATSAATQGRAGGPEEVQAYQAEQQRQQVQKQQSDREMQEGNLRMEALRGNMAINSMNLEILRNNAPLEHQKMINEVEEQKVNFIDKVAKMYNISPIVVKYMMGDSSEQTMGAVNSAAQQNNADLHNLYYGHTQADAKPGNGGTVSAIDLKTNGSKQIPTDLQGLAIAPLNSTLAMGDSLLGADSPNMKQAHALYDQLKTGLSSGNLSMDQYALLQNKMEMLVQAPISRQQAMDKFNKEHNEAQATNPVTKLSTPDELAKPGVQASIKALLDDPNTKPQDRNRLVNLLPKAAAAQQNVLNMKQREARNTQTLSQGDPAAAGALLANGTLTLEELKSRQVTPDFIAKTVAAAKKIDPNFSAPVAAAQAKIAQAPANQQFFGNTDSLLIKGGTLDQLAAAEANLPNGRFPVLNKPEEWVSASLGFGSNARYAAAVLGVADDYAKVMGGSVGTDTARQQILDLASKVQSKASLDAVINQVRQQVRSQRSGRVGSNKYMQAMYPEPAGIDNAPAGAKPPGW